MKTLAALADGPKSQAYADKANLMVVRDAVGRTRPVKTAADWAERRKHILLAMQEVMGPLSGIDRKVPLDVKVSEEVEIVGFRETQKKVVTGIEMFKKLLDEGIAGDNVGLLLRGTEKEDVERGMVLAKPGSITPHTKFKAEVYVLSKDEGGRHTPFFTKYRPQFYFRTSDVTGTVTLPQGVEMVMPGDNVSVEIELIAPVAMEKGQRFAIREGGRTIGAGRVSDVMK